MDRSSYIKFALAGVSIATTLAAPAQTFQLNSDGYFNAGGTDVMAFSDFYPEGHQGGVCVMMNGRRIATNGGIRLEATPGQWQPVPKQLNRADWSYIPGGVVSGTALIRPDFPELLEFPFLWQQTEYVLGGGSSHYMFLVLAANEFQ